MATKFPPETLAVAKKAGVDPKFVVGPFPDRVCPAYTGLFIRIHPTSGNPNWAVFNADICEWGLFSGSKRGALRKSKKLSRKRLTWYGFKKGVVA